MQENLIRDHPVNDQDRNEFARTQGDLGTLFNLIGKLDLAEAASRRAMAIREALVCEHPGSETYRHALAQDYHNLGNHELTAGRLARAESAYRTAMVLREALAASTPATRRTRAPCPTSRIIWASPFNAQVTTTRRRRPIAPPLPSWRCWSGIGRRGPRINITCPIPTMILALSTS